MDCLESKKREEKIFQRVTRRRLRSVIEPAYYGMSVRELFGGAITATLPNEIVDASELRQVPDTQEVFISKICDISYIFDITQSVPPTDLVEATK